jgi:nucleoside-diphosphate-sugar epimerase
MISATLCIYPARPLCPVLLIPDKPTAATPLQETLTANFEGTRTVLELAAAAGHLKALVHVSSAFVNMNQPRSSIVDEQVYPLKFGNQVVDVEELAQVGQRC